MQVYIYIYINITFFGIKIYTTIFFWHWMVECKSSHAPCGAIGLRSRATKIEEAEAEEQKQDCGLTGIRATLYTYIIRDIIPKLAGLLRAFQVSEFY